MPGNSEIMQCRILINIAYCSMEYILSSLLLLLPSITMSADFHFFRNLWLGLINDVILVYCFITELFTLGEGEIMELTPQSISIASVPMIICTTTSIVIAVCCLLEVVAASYCDADITNIYGSKNELTSLLCSLSCTIYQ